MELRLGQVVHAYAAVGTLVIVVAVALAMRVRCGFAIPSPTRPLQLSFFGGDSAAGDAQAEQRNLHGYFDDDAARAGYKVLFISAIAWESSSKLGRA